MPPRLATWVLERFDVDESVIGDLIERYGQRPSNTWYWRQVFVAIVMTFARELRARPLKRSLVLWLLPVVMSFGAWATYTGCPGCIDRERSNSTCQWTGDRQSALNLGIAADRQHLVADAQLAEEVAIRYADAEHKRRFGFEGHGGGIAQGRVRTGCMVRLVMTISTNHGVTAQQIANARGQRRLSFDLAVALLFSPLYCVGALIACRRLGSRFSSHQGYTLLVATGLTSVAVSFLGVQFLQLWLMVWEIVRVGNGHMSGFRAATWNRWSNQDFDAQFLCGVLLFWVVAVLCDRLLPDEKRLTAMPGPQGLILR
jgi:hypothetical protein